MTDAPPCCSSCEASAITRYRLMPKRSSFWPGMRTPIDTFACGRHQAEAQEGGSVMTVTALVAGVERREVKD